ncbi:hypothetical protein [uncultured Mailhella sp.]|uniref:hypothetical protein n=1 Tax=uncultured Mailhella sp. TaxID=1981031 RepID=UPI0026118943|nr:hypothetical protein [uncultured Mailhella sp.]
MNDDAHPSEQTEDIIELLDIVAPQETDPEGQSADKPAAEVEASGEKVSCTEASAEPSEPEGDNAAAASMTDSAVTEPAEKEAAEEAPCHDGDVLPEQPVPGETPHCAADSESALSDNVESEEEPELTAEKGNAPSEETASAEAEALQAEGECCTAEADVEPVAGPYDTKLRELEERLAAAEQARDALAARLEELEQQLADAGTMLLEDAGVRLRLEELVSHMLDAREPESPLTERLDALEGRLRDWEEQSDRRMMQAAARVIREEIAAMKADAS